MRLDRPFLYSALIVITAATGCRDISVPSSSSSQTGPQIQFLSPAADQLIPISYPVNLDVEDAFGIAQVNVRCGPYPLHTWLGPPYQAMINFSVCQTATPAAGGGTRIDLLVTAINRQGGSSKAEIFVSLNPELPEITVTTTAPRTADFLIPRILPNQSVTAHLHSSLPLAYPPQVSLNGTVLLSIPTDGALQEFDVTFTTQRLGVDAVKLKAPGALVSGTVLEDIERTLHLTVDAQSTSGNLTHQELQSVVSRVVWRLPIPGRALPEQVSTHLVPPAYGAANGLHLPLDTGVQPNWLPGLMRSEDGTFSPINTQVLDGGPSVKFSGFAFGGQGIALLSDDYATNAPSQRLIDATAQATLTDFPAGSKPSGISSGPTLPFPTRTGICQETQAVTYPAFCRLGEPVYGLNCVGPGGITQSPNVMSLHDLNPQTELWTTYNDLFFSLNLGSPKGLCCTGPCSRSTWLQFSTFNSSADGIVDDPNFGDVVERLFPLGDGQFFAKGSTESAVYTPSVLNSVSDGGPGSHFLTAQDDGGNGTTGLDAGSVVVKFPTDTGLTVLSGLNGKIITMRYAAPVTVFEAWTPGQTTPDSASQVEGFFEYQPASNFVTSPRNVISTHNGFAVLLKSYANGRVVLVFDRNLQPQWLYRHPFPIQSDVQLISDDDGSHLYFVDFDNQLAAALDRWPL